MPLGVGEDERLWTSGEVFGGCESFASLQPLEALTSLPSQAKKLDAQQQLAIPNTAAHNGGVGKLWKQRRRGQSTRRGF